MKEIKHPYEEFQKTKLWEIITKSIDDLVINQDIELTTRKEYVVGYICKNIDLNFKELIKNK
ncbi:MAG: hypothetical protein Q8K70_00110 [Bacteroidota bacterium]|nr:hypothetical protein [Bacteroidota bacterium]